MAVIIAQAMNHGNFVMSETSDIPYHSLEATYQQYLRQATLKNGQRPDQQRHCGASDLPALFVRFGNALRRRRRPEIRRRATDREGAPFAQILRTRQGRGRLHAAVQSRPAQRYLIGAHEYEAHHVFDIWYRNTSDIMPEAITGDMPIPTTRVNFSTHSHKYSR